MALSSHHEWFRLARKCGRAGIFLLVALLFSGLRYPTEPTSPQGTGENWVVAAYWPNWAAEMQGVPRDNLNQITHLIYAFAEPVLDRTNGQVTLHLRGRDSANSNSGSSQEPVPSWQSIKRGYEGKTLLSIGGWGLSADFSDIAAEASTRQAFIRETIRVLGRHGFDGVDLDWEFPVAGGAPGTRHRVDDDVNFVKLVQELRSELNHQSQLSGRRLLLTVAIAGDPPTHVQRYRLAEMVPHIDWFHLMAYDFSGDWVPTTAHGSALHPRLDQTGAGRVFTVGESVHSLFLRQVPPEKIVLGINLAGRQFEGVEVKEEEGPITVSFESVNYQAEQDGLTAFGKLFPEAKHPGVSPPESQWIWDEEGRVPYLFLVEENILIAPESPRSIFEKQAYAGQHRLRGLMFWSLEKADPSLKLFQKLKEETNR